MLRDCRKKKKQVCLSRSRDLGTQEDWTTGIVAGGWGSQNPESPLSWVANVHRKQQGWERTLRQRVGDSIPTLLLPHQNWALGQLGNQAFCPLCP